MCKRIISTIILLVSAVLITSCLRDESGPLPSAGYDGTVRWTVDFDVSPSVFETRSSGVGNDNLISNVNLYIYKAGKLEWQLYQESSSPITVKLIEGGCYSVYAIANTGQLSAPSLESGLHSFSIDTGLSGGGTVPMATVSGRSLTVSGNAAQNQITLELVRLFAKYAFRLDKSGLEYGDFAVSSVRLRQVSSSVEVFNPEYKALSESGVFDGDYASAADISNVNSSGAIYLYIPENLQGTLLPGNSDPWAKEYFNSSLSSVRKLCSFLEVEGVYTDNSGGLSARHKYKMYLGSDATTNFDVRRNTSYDLTLSVSDLGIFRDSWKVTRSDVSDSRSLSFSPRTVEIPSLGSGVTDIVCSPAGIDYSLVWDESAFASAALSAPVRSGNRVTITNTAALQSDATAYLRAVSFDGAVSAVCTLRVSSASLPELQVQWAGPAPAYVAQAGTVNCSNLFSGSVLSASSGDPSIARLVDLGGGSYRVEAVKEGDVTLSFTRTDGSRTSTKSLNLHVGAVTLSMQGSSFRAYADGGANARSTDGNHEWRISYNVAKDQFDPDLYQELLAPSITLVKSGESVTSGCFDAGENGLYVVSYGSGLSSVVGSYTATISPRGNIYASPRSPLVKTVTVGSPISFSSTPEGENRYYMPDVGSTMTLTAGGSVSLGDPSALSLCIGASLAGYGVGAGFIPCQLETGSSGMTLRVRYQDIIDYFPAPYRFRGNGLRCFARLTNARSGETCDISLSNVVMWLDFAVTSKLECWSSASDWDYADDDHYYIVPCLYSERFENDLFTFTASEAGGMGDLAFPPFYIPRTMLDGIPDKYKIDGATIYLSEIFPSRRPQPAYLKYQLSDRYDRRLCPDVTNWLHEELNWSDEDYRQEYYLSLDDSVSKWFHKKLYWRLYDASGGGTLPDGGHIDILSYGGYSGNYYLRFYDYASELDIDLFED